MNIVHEMLIRAGRRTRQAGIAVIFWYRIRIKRMMAADCRRVVKGGVVVVKPDNLNGEFEIGAVSSTCRRILMHGFYNRKLMRLLERFSDVDGGVVIAGAGGGLSAVHIARTFKNTKQVFALEPDPEAHGWLVNNIKRNGVEHLVRALRICASNKNGPVQMMKFSGRPERTHIVSWKQPSTDDGIEPEKIDAAAASIASIVGETKVALLLLDVGGAEFSALLGAREIIARDRPVLIFVSWQGRLIRYGHNSALLSRLVQGMGYEIRDAFDHRLILIHPFKGTAIALPRETAGPVFSGKAFKADDWSEILGDD